MNEPANGNILEALASPRRPTLVAVDFSEDSRAAVLWASAFNAHVGGPLILLHVVHDPAAEPGYYRADHRVPIQPMERAAERMLEEFHYALQREHPGLVPLQTAGRKLVSGLPPGRIVEAAAEMEAKLIVIGSRGMTGLPHLLQGSVSERVVELADRPVVVIKAVGQQARDQKKKEEKEKRKP